MAAEVLPLKLPSPA
jgi:hypothetical protein